jgi:exonuclease III
MTVEDIFQHETQVLKEMQETTAVTSRKKRSRKTSNYSTGSDGSSDSENDSSLNSTTPRKGLKYSFWTYMMNARSKNVGWRLDYFVTSKRLVDQICDNQIRDQVFGSDHCPSTLFLAL